MKNIFLIISSICLYCNFLFALNIDTINIIYAKEVNTKGMVKIPAGSFLMGSDKNDAYNDEKPLHIVKIKAFWMDETEVTNEQFATFVKATNYITTAEKIPDWDDLKQQLPPNTFKPNKENFVPIGLVFYMPEKIFNLVDYTQWWMIVPQANWRQPEGPDSDIINKENYPVVQISWADAIAYAKWAKKRLPTEAEWEWAARGGLTNKLYPWGNQHPDSNIAKANIWQGDFPIKNKINDGFEKLAPVKSYASNGYGLYDMAGNVWEWCSDWYNENYYEECKKKEPVDNPLGATIPYDSNEPYSLKKIQRGGSFLCNDNYCSGFRVSRRMKNAYDSGTNNTGFRCVNDIQ